MAHPNPQNLIPNSQRSPEELRDMTRKAGIASGAARRKKKTMREAAQACLAMGLLDEDPIREELEKRGLDTNGGQAVLLAQLMRAINGDTEAARFVRDTAGEKPRDGLEIGGFDGRPIESIDLSQLSDEQLKALAVSRENGENDA